LSTRLSSAKAWAGCCTTAGPGWRRPSPGSGQQRAALRVAAHQAGSAAAKGRLGQHAGREIQPGQRPAAAPGQAGRNRCRNPDPARPLSAPLSRPTRPCAPAATAPPPAGSGRGRRSGGPPPRSGGRAVPCPPTGNAQRTMGASLVSGWAGPQGLEQAIHVIFAMGSAQGDAKARRADRHRGRADGAGPDTALPQALGQLQGSDALPPPATAGWGSLAPSRQPSACTPNRNRATRRARWARASSATHTSPMLWRTAHAWAGAYGCCRHRWRAN
jgi:hypothetical protein